MNLDERLAISLCLLLITIYLMIEEYYIRKLLDKTGLGDFSISQFFTDVKNSIWKNRKNKNG